MSARDLREIADLPLTGLRYGLSDKLLRVNSDRNNPVDKKKAEKIVEVLGEAGVRQSQLDHFKDLHKQLRDAVGLGQNKNEIVWEMLILLRLIRAEYDFEDLISVSLDRVMMDWQGSIFAKEELKLFIQSLQTLLDEEDLTEESLNASAAILEGLAPEDPDLSSPAKQLLWAAHLLFLIYNPELILNWPERRRGKNRLDSTQLWRQLLRSRKVRYMRALYASHIFNLLRNNDLMVGWGAPGSWFSYAVNPAPGRINCDLLYSMLAGFEHARACVVHEMGHAVLTRGVPSYIQELSDGIAEMENSDTALTMSHELRLKQYFLNACEDNCVNRFTEQVGKIFGQDYGYSLNHFYTAIGDVGRRFLKQREVYGEATPENRFKNLTFIISRVFLSNNGLFDNTPEGWASLMSHPEWITARDRDNPEEKLEAEAAFDQLIEMCEEVEHYFPPLQEMAGGPRHYGEQAEAYAERRFELIHEMWDLFAKDIVDEILEDEESDVDDAMDQFESNTNTDPPPPKKKQQDKDEQEEPEDDDEEKENDNPAPPTQADQNADNDSDEDLEGEEPTEQKPEEEEGESDGEGEDESTGDGDEGEDESEEGAEDDADDAGDSPPEDGGSGQQSDPTEKPDQQDQQEQEDSEDQQQEGESEEQESQMNDEDMPAPDPDQVEEQEQMQEAEGGEEGEGEEETPSLEELMDQLEQQLEDMDIKKQMDESEDAEQKVEEVEDEEEAEAELVREMVDQTQPPEAKEPPLDEDEDKKGDQGADHGGTADSNQVLDSEYIPEEPLSSISDLMDALKEADEAEEEQQREREKREERRKDREQEQPEAPPHIVNPPSPMGLDELAGGSWEDFSKRVSLHGSVISVMAASLEKLKRAQLKFVHKLSKKHSLIPEGGDLRRFDQRAMDSLIQRIAKREKFDKDHLSMFRKDGRRAAASRPTRIILIDGSRSMTFGGHPMPMDKAIQEAVIDYMASRVAGYDTFITMFGPENPLEIAKPGDSLVEIGKTIEKVTGGLNTMTYLSPALLHTIRQVAYRKKFEENYVGFTNFVIYSDGDIDDLARSRALIEQIIQHAPKTTFDFVLITTKRATPMDVLINTLDAKNPVHEIGVVRGNATRKYPMALTSTYKLTNRLNKASSGFADPSFLRSGQFKRLWQLLTMGNKG